MEKKGLENGKNEGKNGEKKAGKWKKSEPFGGENSGIPILGGAEAGKGEKTGKKRKILGPNLGILPPKMGPGRGERGRGQRKGRGSGWPRPSHLHNLFFFLSCSAPKGPRDQGPRHEPGN